MCLSLLVSFIWSMSLLGVRMFLYIFFREFILSGKAAIFEEVFKLL